MNSLCKDNAVSLAFSISTCIAKDMTPDEIELLAIFFTMLGDNLAGYFVTKSQCKK